MNREFKHHLSGIIAFGLVAASWTWAIAFAPSEQNMGEVYRIIYLHVPMAFAAFTTSLVLAIVSINNLRRANEPGLLLSKAIAEVGLLLTSLTLASGSIWGRPTWGTWWTWDARLTTTLLLGVLYSGWLALHASLESGAQRIKICAAMGILIFADVPIIYQSVNWWRTLHQPQSIIRSGGSTMAPEMLLGLGLNLLALSLLAAWLIMQRYLNLCLALELEAKSYEEI